MRLPSHETGFDLANSLHTARYPDNALARLKGLPQSLVIAKHAFKNRRSARRPNQ